MRILILGAGATGGYFGARLAQAGVDVSFALRPARARHIREHGLCVRSPLGDVQLAAKVLSADQLADAPPFDLVLLSCKAYDLDSAIEAIAPAVSAGTTLLPVLNGLAHYPLLDDRFGADNVLGGLCFISAVLAADGVIDHLDRPARLTFGERSSQRLSPRVQALAAACTAAGIDHVASTDIAAEQWIKFSFLATLAGATCLHRSDLGGILARDGGQEFISGLHEECLAVAAASGHPVADKPRAIARASLTQAGSTMKASMLRDMEAGKPIEAAHLIGDLLARARVLDVATPRLETVWVALQGYRPAA
ncbi:2-dehydropantoate 2-reductase [Stenotrophomonas koreensis]|uniref:2-dehydropantoate 2-reductase n=1 Tax=Stenotrophomonas koreensis TaxID=266128 RepID=A0A0R0BE41_9GAMM|nr:2-dehydropantoate 2-reductase [Stenotrophomonas koreensis]KRG55568.1 2-dehydropantoate 2-reductase [Stenotrophomonas koreensis]